MRQRPGALNATYELEVTMRIDTAIASDAVSLTQIVNAAYRGSGGSVGWTAETDLISGARIRLADMEAMIADPTITILVARDDRHIDPLGCIAVENDDESCMLSMLAVDPAIQGARIGRRLL
ncbi:GNAT family N-acetyltransferase [Tardiphaga alba]|uniref:GNAT family N-acetyltransferase n=1 Tax=Tardiphaga alba TaxID=340268 RepID=A0ABX8A892_9BRAD|nr:hypothetical protein [Tardiphaga alba]QUS38505.1 GNAT family N-acetyltransferase [Tardiphaga alba]